MVSLTLKPLSWKLTQWMTQQQRGFTQLIPLDLLFVDSMVYGQKLSNCMSGSTLTSQRIVRSCYALRVSSQSFSNMLSTIKKFRMKVLGSRREWVVLNITPWTFDFDPNHTSITRNLVWVILLNLPLNFWSIPTLQDIHNSLENI